MKKFLFAVLLCLLGVSVQAMDFPELTGQVVDEAGILTQTTKSKILSMLKPNQQFVVVTLKSLRGYEIEEYGIELARHWGIGHEDYDDGVLLIVAPNERQVRIEVGYGLEGVLTDAQSSSIIRNVLLPAFKANDYNGGIVQAVEVMNRVIDGQQFSIPQEKNSNGLFLLFFACQFGFIIFAVCYARYDRKRFIKSIAHLPPKERAKRLKEYDRKKTSHSSSSGFRSGSSSSRSGGGFRSGGGSFGGGGSSGRW